MPAAGLENSVHFRTLTTRKLRGFQLETFKSRLMPRLLTPYFETHQSLWFKDCKKKIFSQRKCYQAIDEGLAVAGLKLGLATQFDYKRIFSKDAIKTFDRFLKF